VIRFAPAPFAGGGRFLLVGAVLFLAACGGGTPAPEGSSPMPQRSLSAVLAEHAPRLMALEGVALVYEGALADGAPCIKVGLARDTAAIRGRIPAAIEGYPVVVEATGPIVPH
jgi:hypothetical protein